MAKAEDRGQQTRDIERALHEKFMRAALAEAKRARVKDEAPIGAVIVLEGKIIARGHNTRETKKDPLGHAEITAISKAAKKLGAWRLTGCEIYVTLEPCPMCAGAIIQSRIEAVYFGAYDPKAGCCGTIYSLPEDSRFNHRAKVTGGVLEKECASILSEYFSEKRRK